MGRPVVADVTMVPVVAEPRPGDDSGIMTLYSDGIARFESDTRVVSWLSTDPHEYGRVC